MNLSAAHELTTNIGRIGGFERNFPNVAFEKLEKFLDEYPRALKELDKLINAQPHFYGTYNWCWSY